MKYTNFVNSFLFINIKDNIMKAFALLFVLALVSCTPKETPVAPEATETTTEAATTETATTEEAAATTDAPAEEAATTEAAAE